MRAPVRRSGARGRTGPGPLVRSRVIAAVAVVGAFAIAAGAFWLVAPPAAAPAAIAVASATHRISVVVDAREGCSTATAEVTDNLGRPLRATPVEVQAVMPLMGVAMPATTATTSTTGDVTALVCLAMTGPWEVRFTVRGPEADTLVAPVEVTG
jgi:hypothetical protein